MKSFSGKLTLEAIFICFLLLFGTSVSPILAADGSKDGAYSDSILIDNLEDIGTESIGIINDEQGGLGINLWQSSSRELVINLLGLLPEKYSSQVLRNLATRLLLTNAIAPTKSGIGRNDPNAGDGCNSQQLWRTCGNLCRICQLLRDRDRPRIDHPYL